MFFKISIFFSLFQDPSLFAVAKMVDVCLVSSGRIFFSKPGWDLTFIFKFSGEYGSNWYVVDHCYSKSHRGTKYIFLCSCILPFLCSFAPPFFCSSVPLFLRSCILPFLCSFAPPFFCSSVPLFLRSSVPLFFLCNLFSNAVFSFFCIGRGKFQSGSTGMGHGRHHHIGQRGLGIWFSTSSSLKSSTFWEPIFFVVFSSLSFFTMKIFLVIFVCHRNCKRKYCILFCRCRGLAGPMCGSNSTAVSITSYWVSRRRFPHAGGPSSKWLEP